jgi:hypothetical protein
MLDPVLAAEIAKAISAEFYLTRSIFEPCHLDDDDAEAALREIILRTANIPLCVTREKEGGAE